MKIFFLAPNRTSQEKVVASRSDCNSENRAFIVDSGASLDQMSESEITSGEKETIIKSKEPTVIPTASGKAEPTEEATVYVNDLDVFVRTMLLGDSPTVLSLGLFCLAYPRTLIGVGRPIANSRCQIIGRPHREMFRNPMSHTQKNPDQASGNHCIPRCPGTGRPVA